jgi:crotonobetainyl-CoA:carnitine CoA-transferase CaiB-like acyl-CoA transferase
MEGQDAFFAPLTRFKVIDFTQIGAGPLCGMYLGDLGADVIKVEPPAGDLGRKLGLPWIDDESPMNIAFNRNKRSICIDLKTSAGREVVVKLLAEADVLLESFRPGVMAQFGLDYEGARQINPRRTGRQVRMRTSPALTA